MTLKELVGKRIESIDMESNEAIRFNTDAGPICYAAYGDCCSSTWVEHVEGVDRLIGATVGATDDIKLPDRGSLHEHDEVAT